MKLLLIFFLSLVAFIKSSEYKEESEKLEQSYSYNTILKDQEFEGLDERQIKIIKELKSTYRSVTWSKNNNRVFFIKDNEYGGYSLWSYNIKNKKMKKRIKQLHLEGLPRYNDYDYNKNDKISLSKDGKLLELRSMNSTISGWAYAWEVCVYLYDTYTYKQIKKERIIRYSWDEARQILNQNYFFK